MSQNVYDLSEDDEPQSLCPPDKRRKLQQGLLQSNTLVKSLTQRLNDRDLAAPRQQRLSLSPQIMSAAERQKRFADREQEELRQQHQRNHEQFKQRKMEADLMIQAGVVPQPSQPQSQSSPPPSISRYVDVLMKPTQPQSKPPARPPAKKVEKKKLVIPKPLFALSNIDLLEYQRGCTFVSEHNITGMTQYLDTFAQDTAKLTQVLGMFLIAACSLITQVPTHTQADTDRLMEGISLSLAFGADVNYHNGMALLSAIQRAPPAVVSKLIENGADVNKCGQYVPIIYAVSRQRNDMVDILLRSKANVDSKDIYGHTALSTAVVNDYAQTVETLIQYGADITVKINNHTVVQLADALDKKHLISILTRAK